MRIVIEQPRVLMILPIVGRVQVRRGQMMVDDMFSVSKGWLIAKEGQQMRKKKC